MHGRARPPKGFQPTAEQIEKQEKKTKLLKAATSEVLESVKEHGYKEKTMKMSGKLLMLNPEIYTAWNYRKDAISQFLGSISEEERKETVKEELTLVAEALRSNPKSYGAWYHRRWLVDNGHCELHDELHFVEEKLQEDIRNFHAWNYRFYLVKKFNRSPDAELQYSSQMIEQNFSNYSAWNHRRMWLEQKHHPHRDKDMASTGSLTEEILRQECQLVHAAFVTDPDDSSAWVYYRWLISGIRQLQNDALWNVLDNEITFFENELLPLGMTVKWMLLTYATLLEVRDKMKGTTSDKVTEICSKLMEIDPMRAGFYRDVIHGKASISVGTEAAS